MTALRSQLEFLVECSDTQMGDPAPHHPIFHRCLGAHALCSHLLEQDAHLAVARVRCRPWCSKMVSGMILSMLRKGPVI